MPVIKKPSILLPKDCDMTKWSVVACDQFTAQPEYWKELESLVEDEISSLNITLPEIYLHGDIKGRIAKIQRTMGEYLGGGIFDQINDFILVKRTLKNGTVRLGLMLEVDLDSYDYTPKNNALIKATEKTVVERLPARIQVRIGASLELPHIMLLVDDPDKTIIEPLYTDCDLYDKLYDFDLSMNGGNIVGYRVNNPDDVVNAINKIMSPETALSRYNSEQPILFCVGDGNHSLATAKECWNSIKDSLSEDERENHPAKYALCELVNLHDESLVFEPIHRLIIGANDDFIVNMARELDGEERMKVLFEDREYILNIPANPADAIKDIQDCIDLYIDENTSIEQDYIHGDDYLTQIARDKGAIAIFMPTIDKSSLFDYCLRRGSLPRKSFSMGVAEDKRYYLEARKICK